jgi:hypothetical protein
MILRFFRMAGITVGLLLLAGCAIGRIGNSWGVKLQVLTLEITERQMVGVRIAPQGTNSISNTFPEPIINPSSPP